MQFAVIADFGLRKKSGCPIDPAAALFIFFLTVKVVV
jgi:hypothetical protein